MSSGRQAPPPALNYQDAQIIQDAVRMMKSQFVELYVGLDYTSGAAGAAWHIIRTSKRGQELADKLYKGRSRQQALTFIGDMKEEIAERKKYNNRLPKTEEEVEEEVEVAVEEEKVVKKEKVKTIKPIKQNNSMKGEKATRVLSLIESGVRTFKELSEQALVSKAYAKYLLEKNGCPQGRVKKEKVVKAAKATKATKVVEAVEEQEPQTNA